MLHVLNILKASFGNKFICKLHLSRILLHFSRSSYNYWLTRSATGGMCHLPNLTKKEHWPSMEAHIAQFLQREWLNHYTRPFWQYRVQIKNKSVLRPYWHLGKKCGFINIIRLIHWRCKTFIKLAIYIINKYAPRTLMLLDNGRTQTIDI